MARSKDSSSGARATKKIKRKGVHAKPVPIKILKTTRKPMLDKEDK